MSGTRARSTRPRGSDSFGSKSKWSHHFGLTEKEVELMVALIAAQKLGYDGATTAELLQIKISYNVVNRIMGLCRRGLVEIAGHTDDVRSPKKIWRATALGFESLGIQRPRPVWPSAETEAGRAELMAQRAEDRQKERSKRARKGQVAA